VLAKPYRSIDSILRALRTNSTVEVDWTQIFTPCFLSVSPFGLWVLIQIYCYSLFLVKPNTDNRVVDNITQNWWCNLICMQCCVI